MRKQFLLVFSGVFVTGCIALAWFVRFEIGRGDPASDFKKEQAAAAAQASVVGTSNAGPDNKVSRDEIVSAVALSTTRDVAASSRMTAAANNALLDRQSIGDRAVGGKITEAGAAAENGVGYPLFATIARDSIVSEARSAETDVNPTSDTANLPAPDVESPPAEPTPRVRRYPFTPDEEWYRLWHGWQSIDAYRAAKAAEENH